MANVALSGGSARISYGWETTAFRTSASTFDKTFGHGCTLSVRRNNSAEAIYGLGSREASASVAKNWIGEFTLEFIHSSEVNSVGGSAFWKWVLGKVDDGGTTPKTHTFAYNTDKTLTSITLNHGLDQPTTDYDWNLLGAVVNTCEVSFRQNEPVRVRIEGLYADETLDNALVTQVNPATTDVPYEFAEATVTLSSALTRCEEFILTINNNAEMIYGLGDRRASAAIGKNVVCTFRFTITHEASTWDALLYGQATGPLTTTTPAETGTLTINVTNSGAGSAERELIFNLANAFINTSDISFDPTGVVRVTYEGWCRTITSIVQEDNTTSTP